MTSIEAGFDEISDPYKQAAGVQEIAKSLGLTLGQKVRLTKLRATENPEVPTARKEEYPYGTSLSNQSLPVDYTLEGYLTSKLVEGSRLQILRTKRNEVYAVGVMETSPVVKIEQVGPQHLQVQTSNSIYELFYLNGSDRWSQ